METIRPINQQRGRQNDRGRENGRGNEEEDAAIVAATRRIKHRTAYIIIIYAPHNRYAPHIARTIYIYGGKNTQKIRIKYTQPQKVCYNGSMAV